MTNRQPYPVYLIIISVVLVCLCGCTSIRPLEPGGMVYPPDKKQMRYDMVPPHSHAIRIPVTRLRGDPSQLRIKIIDQYNPTLEFDSEATLIAREGYLLYELNRTALSNRYAKVKIENPPAQVTVQITDKPDSDENFIMRWFKWWGRSDSANYFIGR